MWIFWKVAIKLMQQLRLVLSLLRH